jgi:hypothetical protein
MIHLFISGSNYSRGGSKPAESFAATRSNDLSVAISAFGSRAEPFGLNLKEVAERRLFGEGRCGGTLGRAVSEPTRSFRARLMARGATRRSRRQAESGANLVSHSLRVAESGQRLFSGRVIARIAIINRVIAERGKLAPKRSECRAARQEQIQKLKQVMNTRRDEIPLLQKRLRIAGQARLDIQRMHAGTTAAARHEEGAVIGDRAATGHQRPLSFGVGQAIATGLGPWGQVQSIVAGPQELLGIQKAAASNRYLRVLNRLKDTLASMPGLLGN